MANEYDEYRNSFYNPDDSTGASDKPGDNANWKAIQKGFYLMSNVAETAAELIDELRGKMAIPLFDANTVTCNDLANADNNIVGIVCSPIVPCPTMIICKSSGPDMYMGWGIGYDAINNYPVMIHATFDYHNGGDIPPISQITATPITGGGGGGDSAVLIGSYYTFPVTSDLDALTYTDTIADVLEDGTYLTDARLSPMTRYLVLATYNVSRGDTEQLKNDRVNIINVVPYNGEYIPTITTDPAGDITSTYANVSVMFFAEPLSASISEYDVYIVVHFIPIGPA